MSEQKTRCRFCHKEHVPLKPCPEAKEIWEQHKEDGPYPMVTLQENELREKHTLKDISFMCDKDGNVIVQPQLMNTDDGPCFTLKMTPTEFVEKVYRMADYVRLMRAAGVFGDQYELNGI